MVSAGGQPQQHDVAPDVRWSTFARRCIALILGAFATVPAMNLVIDPYEVFGTRLLRPASTLNERVVKTRVVLNAEKPYDVMLFGSSVAGVIDPRLLAPPDKTYYNMSFFSATPGDVLAILRLLERNDRLPRIAYVGLDPFMFTRPSPGEAQLRLPHEASGESIWVFWRDYLFANSPMAIANKVAEQLPGAQALQFDLAVGAYRILTYDALISDDPAAYARTRVEQCPLPGAGPWWYAPALRELAALVEWTHGHPHVTVIWFAQPLHHRMRSALGLEAAAYVRAIREAVGPGLSDLSDHPIGSDNRLWYECKHYRPAAAPALAERLRAELASRLSH